MNLPKAPGCKASVTLYGPNQKNRVEEATEEEDTSQREGYREYIREAQIQKTGTPESKGLACSTTC